MAKLFEIPLTGGGSLDVTPFIVLNSYTVGSKPVYKKWNDGAGNERRSITRRRLEGTFSLKFFKPKDYQDFLSAVNNQRATGFDYVPVNIYDNKTRTVKQNANVYIDFENANVEPSVGWSFNDEIEITITER